MTARTARHARLRSAREVLALVVGSPVLAVLMTWPALRNPTRTVPQDLIDPLYFAWQISWTAHGLGSAPMYTTNAFLGAPGDLAYTDVMLGYAPLAALVRRIVPGVEGALLVVNLLYVLTAALAFAGAYLLARVVGARAPGALVAAAAYAYAPWHLAHARHLNVLSTGGIVLALALLAYGHGVTLRARQRRRVVRPGWILAGWAVACWQLTLGFALGVPFAWALALLLGWGVVTLLRARRAARMSVPSPGDTPSVHGRRELVASLAGAVAFGVTGVLLALPYRSVVAQFPVARRTEQMVHTYSPPLRGLITAPAESWVWGAVQSGLRAGMAAPAEQTVLPGVVLFVVAMVGLRYSAWAPRPRGALAAIAVVSGVLTVGTSAPGGGHWTYLPVFRHLPGWEAIRTPGRLVLWLTLALALLAAGAVTRLADDVAARHLSGRRAAGRVAAGLMVLPALAVLVEGGGTVAARVVPSAPVALASLPGAVLVLPTSQQGDYLPMTWSTAGWPLLANGGSGFEPPTQAALRRTAASFPSRESAADLRSAGVSTVVLVRSRASGTPWQVLAGRSSEQLTSLARAAGVGLADRGDAVVFDLR